MSSGGVRASSVRTISTRAALVVVLLAAALFAATSVPAEARTGAPMRAVSVGRADPPWLARLNLLRALSGLQPLAEDPALSTGTQNHAEYMVLNDVISHDEEPGNPGYTTSGDAAAAASNVAAWNGAAVTEDMAIDIWMPSIFHGLGLVDADLTETGFGLHTDGASPGIKAGAALNVIDGIVGGSNDTAYPIAWPGNNATVPYTNYQAEAPDARTKCTGTTGGGGMPMLVQFSSPPVVTGHSLRRVSDNALLARCLVTPTNYTNPNSGLQTTGRSILAARNAVAILPNAPLTLGESYRFSVTANGQTVTSTFTVGPLALPLFRDVGPTHPFLTQIQWMVDQGIATGYADGTFRPTLPVSRQAAAAYLYRYSGSPGGPFPPHGFSDVLPANQFSTAIAWMVDANLTEGYPDGTFHPTESVTRQSLCAYLFRLAGEPGGPFPAPPFSDVTDGHPFFTEIAWASSVGVVGGYGDGTFRPGVSVSRQAFASFLYEYDQLP